MFIRMELYKQLKTNLPLSVYVNSDGIHKDLNDIQWKLHVYSKYGNT